MVSKALIALQRVSRRPLTCLGKDGRRAAFGINAAGYCAFRRRLPRKGMTVIITLDEGGHAKGARSRNPPIEVFTRGFLFTNHHIGRLNDCPGIVACFQPKLGNGFVCDGCSNYDTQTNVDPNMGSGRPLGQLDNCAFELVPCAEFHEQFLRFDLVIKLLFL
jgi:hypothetical protein